MRPDLMSGVIDLVGDQIPTYVEQIKAGQITAVATFGSGALAIAAERADDEGARLRHPRRAVVRPRRAQGRAG